MVTHPLSTHVNCHHQASSTNEQARAERIGIIGRLGGEWRTTRAQSPLITSLPALRSHPCKLKVLNHTVPGWWRSSCQFSSVHISAPTSAELMSKPIGLALYIREFRNWLELMTRQSCDDELMMMMMMNP